LLEAFHEVFPGFSSKAKVSSTIEKNDLSHLPKDVADKYKDSPEWTEEQIKGLEDFINGKPKKNQKVILRNIYLISPIRVARARTMSMMSIIFSEGP